MTASLTVNDRKPVPIGEAIDLRARSPGRASRAKGSIVIFAPDGTGRAEPASLGGYETFSF